MRFERSSRGSLHTEGVSQHGLQRSRLVEGHDTSKTALRAAACAREYLPDSAEMTAAHANGGETGQGMAGQRSAERPGHHDCQPCKLARDRNRQWMGRAFTSLQPPTNSPLTNRAGTEVLPVIAASSAQRGPDIHWAESRRGMGLGRDGWGAGL